MLHFTKLLFPPQNELRLGNTRIQKSETVKYLGLVFDSEPDWKADIQQLNSKFNKALNFIRSVGSTEWGADQKTLMMIYRSLVRSKLDNGFIVYNSASSMELESLESISNEGMRISSGWFKSTLKYSVQVITEEPPIEIRMIS